ncbi:hypothetical protein DFJ77DRAFT_542203 [Powellomyces hirtus]|nr:hypothetical protein DFJ77DRAFT_542203 [Powellomyces hirtus]
MLATSLSPTATTTTSPADCVLRQDSKDAIAKSTTLLKLFAKHRAALLLLATTTNDVADALRDLSSARAVRVAERCTPAALNQGKPSRRERREANRAKRGVEDRGKLDREPLAFARSGRLRETGVQAPGIAQTASDQAVRPGRTNPFSFHVGALRHCAEFHSTISRRLREYGDRMLRELEEPLQSSIEEHAQTVSSNEKRLVQMEREISDKVKKSELRSRKKWNRDAAAAEQAARDLARYTLELSDLKFHNQHIIVGEEARHVRVMEDQWATLMKSFGLLMGHTLAGVSTCVDKLSDPSKGGFKQSHQPTYNSANNDSSSSSGGNTYGYSAGRRGSLDSNLGDVITTTAATRVDEKPLHSSLGRRVAKMVNAVAATTTQALNTSMSSNGSSGSSSRPTSPRRAGGNNNSNSNSNSNSNASPKTSRSNSPANSAGTASPHTTSASLAPINTSLTNAMNATFPQLSLPSFSPLTSKSPSSLGRHDSSSASPSSSPAAAAQHTTTLTPSVPPKPVLKSSLVNTTSTGSNSSTSGETKRRVAFPTSKPIATVQQTAPSSSSPQSPKSPSSSNPQTSTLSSLYPDIFAAENTLIAHTPVLAHRAVVKNPAVYVAGGEGDAESQIGSVVGTTESLVGVLPTATRNLDLVYAIHDFGARSAKEMSLRKGDVMEVKKRHGTWIYGTKFTRRSKSVDTGLAATDPALKDRFRRGVPQDDANNNNNNNSNNSNTSREEKPEVGWIPMAFVAKFSAA